MDIIKCDGPTSDSDYMLTDMNIDPNLKVVNNSGTVNINDGRVNIWVKRGQHRSICKVGAPSGNSGGSGVVLTPTVIIDPW